MNVFETHEKTIADYASYIKSFINIADAEISKKVDSALAEGKLWPDPLLPRRTSAKRTEFPGERPIRFSA